MELDPTFKLFLTWTDASVGNQAVSLSMAGIMCVLGARSTMVFWSMMGDNSVSPTREVFGALRAL